MLSSAVLGKPLEELFCDAARVKAQAAQAASDSSAACAFPLQAIASRRTYTATVSANGTSTVLDLRAQPAVPGAVALGVPLWDAVDNLFAANDVASLFHLAATTLRRMLGYHHCAIYSVGTHATASTLANEMKGSLGFVHTHRGSHSPHVMVQAVNVLTESRDKHVRVAGDPLHDAEGRPTARSVRVYDISYIYIYDI